MRLPAYNYIILASGLALSCINGSGVPLPIEPAVEFKKPTAAFWFEVTPNPTPTGVVTQQWTTGETAGIAYDIVRVTERFYRADSSLNSSRPLTPVEMDAAFDGSLFIPANDTIQGVRNATIPSISGGWIDYIMRIQDDLDNILVDSIRVFVQ